MPPEHLPLDRKDFFYEKKNDRAETLAPSAARWTDSHRGSADDLCRPPGLFKQGSYQVFPEESGHGCTTSQFGERTAEGDVGRPSAASTDGKYERSSSSRIENKAAAFSGHKDWKGNSHHPRPWAVGGSDASPGSDSSGSRRQYDVSAARGHSSVDDLPVKHTSHTLSDAENSRESNSKDQHDKLVGEDGLGAGDMYDKDHSLGSITWKARKWTRSGSLSSRASGFTHSTGAKVDSNDSGIEFLARKEAPVRSLCVDGDGADGLMLTALVEDTRPQKKQRLGWGQGLAKYEKEKVEGPEDSAGRSGLVHCASNAKSVHNTDALSSRDRSPKASSASECMSPATPCSVACSSSFGLEERSNAKVTNSDNDTSHFSDSPGQGVQKRPGELFANMEHLELNPISNISSLLVNLLPSQDASSGDSDFVQSTALNKLFLLKADILKLLEKTECDIDICENELKSLDCMSETNATCPTAPEPVRIVTILNPLEKQADSAPKLAVKEQLPCNDPLEVNAEAQDEDVDSPGTVTSKCSVLTSVEHGVPASDRMNLDEHAADFEPSNFLALGAQSSGPFVSMERPSALCDGEYRTCLYASSAGAHASSLISQNDEADGSLRALIFSSNKELARKAWEVFDKALPSNLLQFDMGRTDNSVCSKKSYLNIREKLIMHKQFKKFKEWVLTLKFRALHHSWIEEMRFLSLRKNRAKSQKRLELSCRYSHSGYQKHRASIRSRPTSSGDLSTVPTTEPTDFTSSKLPSDSQIKCYRDGLKMPALILDDQRHSRFITNNGLVEDPCAVEKEHTMINPWMPDEKEVFMEKLATLGKDFAKIASFLRHKTTADCIEFYYKNHKSESFENVKKRLELRKQSRCYPANAYMVTSGKKWNRDVNAASLDMLGAASAVASHAGHRETGRMYTGVPILRGNASIGNYGSLERTTSVEVPGNESEAAAADALASICGGLSSEAMSSCITSSVDPWEGCQEWKGQKARSMAMEKPFTPAVSQNIDEDTFSDDSCGELESADWTDEEKSSFIVALRTCGKDFARISKFVGTRSRDQCKIFFSKARKCLSLDLIHRDPKTEGTRMSDPCGGRSDTEDACVAEMDSAICSMQSCSKIDVDMPPSVPSRCGEESGNVENNLLQIEPDKSNNRDEVGGSNPEVDIGKKKLEPIVQTVTDSGRAFGVDNIKLKKDDGWSGTVPEVLQMDAVTTVDAAALNCNMSRSVQLLDEADSFVNPDKKVYGTDHTRSDVQVDSVNAKVQLELGHSTNAVVEPKQEEQSRCRPYARAEPRQEIKPSSTGVLLEPKSEPLPVIGLDDVRVSHRGVDASRCSAISQDLPVSSANRNSSLQEVDACPSITSVPDHQHQTSLELHPSVRMSQIISWQQENCPRGLANSANSTNSDHDRLCRERQMMSIFEDQGNMHHQKTETSDICYQYLPSQIFRGYPLQIMNKHADLIGEKSVKKTSKLDKDFQLSQSVLEKFDGSKSPVSVTELPLLSNSCERLDDLLRSTSRGLEEQAAASSFETEEKSLRTGDVKLFGQILGHLSPLQKVNSPQERNDEVVSPKSSQSFGFKFLEHGQNGTFNGSKLETSSNLGRQESLVTSFGLWDGNNRMHNAIPLLSDSAIMSAINNYSVPTCQIEPRPLRRNDRVLGCVLGYPTKDASVNGGLGNHQVYQSFEGANVKPFLMDVKRQEHNGFETLLGFQQGSAVVGMSSVGGGIVVGSCTGASDPVAAIKKHFANEARSGGRSAGVIREGESWSGDVAR